jgi:Tfp pilus assembly protein PilZ
MHILVARFRDGGELLAHYQESFLYGGLFFPTRKVIRPGEIVVLDVRMPGLRDYALVRGMVAWHRRGRRGQGVRAGLAIEFLASEQAKRDFLLSLARGKRDATAQRRHRRLPTELRVDWRIPNDTDRHLSLVDDIGAGGAFLRTRHEPALGTAILIEIVPPGSTAPQTIEGRVAWMRGTPGAEGLGVEFRCRDIGGKRRLRELVRRIEKHSANQLA